MHFFFLFFFLKIDFVLANSADPDKMSRSMALLLGCVILISCGGFCNFDTSSHSRGLVYSVNLRL